MDTIQAVLDVAADAGKGLTRDRRLCVLITLDVKNAFNTVPWICVDAAASKMELPSYARRFIRCT